MPTVGLRDIFANVRQAFRGEYVYRDENGVSYKDRYMQLDHAVGRRGFREDQKNLAGDMKAALKRYEQKKDGRKSYIKNLKSILI